MWFGIKFTAVVPLPYAFSHSVCPCALFFMSVGSAISVIFPIFLSPFFLSSSPLMRSLFKYVSIGHGHSVVAVVVHFFFRYQYIRFFFLCHPFDMVCVCARSTFLLCLCIWGMSHILLLLICVLFVLGLLFPPTRLLMRLCQRCFYFGFGVCCAFFFCTPFHALLAIFLPACMHCWPNLFACFCQFEHESIRSRFFSRWDKDNCVHHNRGGKKFNPLCHHGINLNNN